MVLVLEILTELIFSQYSCMVEVCYTLLEKVSCCKCKYLIRQASRDRFVKTFAGDKLISFCGFPLYHYDTLLQERRDQRGGANMLL